MNIHSVSEAVSPAYSHAFGPTLSLADLRARTPAAFAGNASARLKTTYKFISTAEVVHALIEAGFQPSAAQQTRSRAGSDPTYARHMIRMRHVRDSVEIIDAIPELCLVNAHDGTSAYQLLAGLYRPLCTNGLLCRMGDFAVVRVAHRSTVIADVVAGALAITAQFEPIRTQVAAMAARTLSDEHLLEFAAEAFEIRYAKVENRPAYSPSRFLEIRRAADATPTLWHALNRTQEAAMAGGVSYRSRTQRLVRTRRLSSIRESVRINTALWQAACRRLEG